MRTLTHTQPLTLSHFTLPTGLKKCETLLASPLPPPFCIPAPTSLTIVKSEEEKSEEKSEEKVDEIDGSERNDDKKDDENVDRNVGKIDEIEVKVNETSVSTSTSMIISGGRGGDVDINKMEVEENEKIEKEVGVVLVSEAVATQAPSVAVTETEENNTVKAIVNDIEKNIEKNSGKIVEKADLGETIEGVVKVVDLDAVPMILDTEINVKDIENGNEKGSEIVSIIPEGEVDSKIVVGTETSGLVGVSEGLSDSSMSRLCCAFILYGCPLHISPKDESQSGENNNSNGDRDGDNSNDNTFIPTMIPLNRMHVLGMYATPTDLEPNSGIELFDIKSFTRASSIIVSEKELSDFYQQIWLPFCCSIFKKNIVLSHLYKKVIPSPMKKAADHHIATRGKYGSTCRLFFFINFFRVHHRKK